MMIIHIFIKCGYDLRLEDNIENNRLKEKEYELRK